MKYIRNALEEARKSSDLNDLVYSGSDVSDRFSTVTSSFDYERVFNSLWELGAINKDKFAEKEFQREVYLLKTLDGCSEEEAESIINEGYFDDIPIIWDESEYKELIEECTYDHQFILAPAGDILIEYDDEFRSERDKATERVKALLKKEYDSWDDAQLDEYLAARHEISVLGEQYYLFDEEDCGSFSRTWLFGELFHTGGSSGNCWNDGKRFWSITN